MTEGFHGEIALATLTRPAVAIVMPTESTAIDRQMMSSGLDLAALEAILRTDMPRQRRIAAVADYLRTLKSIQTQRALGPLGSYTEQKLAEGMVVTHDRLEVQRRGGLDTEVRLDTPEPVVDLPDFRVD